MYDRFRQWLFRLGPERAHAASIAVGQVAQFAAFNAIRQRFAYLDASLGQRVAGMEFRNPVGLAAGADKDGKLLPLWDALGFGFAEVGSVTVRPSRGNPRPRAFRLPEEAALINRMGLPNQGAIRIGRRLARLRARCRIPVGISLARTHGAGKGGMDPVEDYRRSFMLLAPLADYVALNISCPNTDDGRTFEDPASLDTLLGEIYRQRNVLIRLPPVFLKLSPPTSVRVVFDSQVDEILAVGRAHGVAGYIACNTAPDRDGLRTSPETLAAMGAGGLSGVPLRPRMLRQVRYLYSRLGPGTPIIGVGGIDSAESAYQALRAGASVVQLYTALVYKGPGLLLRILEGLSAICERERLGTISDAIGLDA